MDPPGGLGKDAKKKAPQRKTKAQFGLHKTQGFSQASYRASIGALGFGVSGLRVKRARFNARPEQLQIFFLRVPYGGPWIKA